jgi:hypothetical protein
MVGAYQHCGEQHFQRFVNELAFRYSCRAARGYSDTKRATSALKGIAGNQLTNRRINAA